MDEHAKVRLSIEAYIDSIGGSDLPMQQRYELLLIYATNNYIALLNFQKNAKRYGKKHIPVDKPNQAQTLGF